MKCASNGIETGLCGWHEVLMGVSALLEQERSRQQGETHRGLHHKQLARLRDEINEKQRVIDDLTESVDTLSLSTQTYTCLLPSLCVIKLFLFFSPPLSVCFFHPLYRNLCNLLPCPPHPSCSRNLKLEVELAQVRADFDRLKSQDNTKSERLEELS